MKKPTITPTNQAREFLADELFCSTTDLRGVIETGNDVFFRVAGYDEAEVVGQPHNLIRHPDMPRGAFKLVWQHLLAGKPVAAYVKNLARNGDYYWVLAMIAPIDGGFLSVRSKPCAPLFAAVQALYRDMRAAELAAEPAAAMTASAQVLAQRLTTLGYADYDDFMARALLPQELAARKAQVGALAAKRDGSTCSTEDPVQQAIARASAELQRTFGQLKTATVRLGPVLEGNGRAVEASRAVTRVAEGIGLMAMNVSLRAVQLGETGLGTGVIAGFLGDGATQLRARVQELAARLQTLTVRLGEVVVESGWAELEYEMVLRAFDEAAAARANGTASADSTRRRMLGLSRLRVGVMGTRRRMVAALGPFLQALPGIRALADSAHELIIALEAGQVGGRVESARLPEQHSMESLLVDLQGQLAAARAHLTEVNDSVASLSDLRAVMAATERVVLEGAAALERNIAALEQAWATTTRSAA